MDDQTAEQESTTALELTRQLKDMLNEINPVGASSAAPAPSGGSGFRGALPLRDEQEGEQEDELGEQEELEGEQEQEDAPEEEEESNENDEEDEEETEDPEGVQARPPSRTSNGTFTISADNSAAPSPQKPLPTSSTRFSPRSPLDRAALEDLNAALADVSATRSKSARSDARRIGAPATSAQAREADLTSDTSTLTVGLADGTSASATSENSPTVLSPSKLPGGLQRAPMVSTTTTATTSDIVESETFETLSDMEEQMMTRKAQEQHLHDKLLYFLFLIFLF